MFINRDHLGVVLFWISALSRRRRRRTKTTGSAAPQLSQMVVKKTSDPFRTSQSEAFDTEFLSTGNTHRLSCSEMLPCFPNPMLSVPIKTNSLTDFGSFPFDYNLKDCSHPSHSPVSSCFSINRPLNSSTDEYHCSIISPNQISSTCRPESSKLKPVSLWETKSLRPDQNGPIVVPKSNRDFSIESLLGSTDSITR